MIKTIFDFLIALIALILLSPILLLVATLIRIKLGENVIFSQDRPGLHSKTFKMYKFRSMLNSTDATGKPLPDKQRLTSFGAKLRATSLDELPALWNVLKGDISLVGPRPLLVEYLPLYNQEQARRHNVKPGITGWAQINGRNAISWEDKFKFDIWYIDNQTFMLDLKIIFLTIKKIFIKEGISHAGSATMSKFTGNDNQSVTYEE